VSRAPRKTEYPSTLMLFGMNASDPIRKYALAYSNAGVVELLNTDFKARSGLERRYKVKGTPVKAERK